MLSGYDNKAGKQKEKKNRQIELHENFKNLSIKNSINE